MGKYKILFLTTQLPYPPTSGGVIKSFHFLEHLSHNNSVSLACFLKNDDLEHEKEFLEKIPLNSYFSTRLNVDRNVATLVKSYFLSSTINNYRNKSKRFKDHLKKYAGEVDILIVDHYEMFQYVPKDYKGKVILHTHNAEFALWERMSELEKGILKNFILKIEANRVKKAEKSAIQQSDLVYATPSDISLYRLHGIDSKNYSLTYHLGDISLLHKATLQFNKTEECLFFVGTLSWEPNVNGLLWFLNKVWPILQKTTPDLHFYIVGKKPDKRLLNLKTKGNVIFTGFVEDLEQYYQKSRVAVVPLKFGSGMKVKLLEAMYRGLPAVSTSVGTEGIQLKHGENIFIEDDPYKFAEKIQVLLTNKNIWEEFSKKSRKVAAEEYTWDKLFEKMDKALNNILEK